MADKPTAPAGPGGLDAGLAGAAFGGGSLMGNLESIIQSVLLGATNNPRQGLTSQPLVNMNLMPRWARNNPELRKAVYGGGLDPYLPSNDPGSWQVFISGSDMSKTTATSSATAAEQRATLRGDQTRTVSAVVNEPFLWDENEVADAIKKFQKAGVTSVVDFDSLQKAWSGLAQRAGAMYSLSSGQKKVTPWDVLDLYKSEVAKAGTGGAGGSGGFTGTHTQTQKTVTEIREADAWSALRQTTSQLLGHDPDDQEVRDFAYRMNSLAAANPSISTTTGNYQDGQLTNSSTKTKPGFGSADVARNAYDDAQEDPDYAEYQSSTTYFNAALAALGEIGA